jgi:hypothetical protein
MRWPRWLDRKIDLTGIGTLLLAIATFGAVAIGVRTLNETKSQIGVSKSQIAISTRDLQESHRPVLVGVAESGRLIPRAGSAGRTVPARPYVLPYHGPPLNLVYERPTSTLIIPVENVGAGPALNVSAQVVRWATTRNEYAAPAAAPVTQQAEGTATGLGVGGLVQLEIHMEVPKTREIMWNGSPGFIVSIIYADGAGKRWETLGTWVPEAEAYAGVDVTPWTGHNRYGTRNP